MRVMIVRLGREELGAQHQREDAAEQRATSDDADVEHDADALVVGGERARSGPSVVAAGSRALGVMASAACAVGVGAGVRRAVRRPGADARLGAALVAQRLDELDERGGLAGLEHALVGRHDRLEAATILARGIHHRLGEVGLVGDAPCRRRRAATARAEEAAPRSGRCAACRRACGSAGSRRSAATRALRGQRDGRSRGRRLGAAAASGLAARGRTRRASLEPARVVVRRERDDLAAHHRVTGAAVLGAEDRVACRARSPRTTRVV